MRDSLIEILKNFADGTYTSNGKIVEGTKVDDIADLIIADGWIRPPCKVGDTVYYFSHRPLNLSVKANTVYEAEVVRIVTNRMGTSLIIQIRNEYGCTEVPDIRSWGISVFATKEEAEAKLKGGVEE